MARVVVVVVVVVVFVSQWTILNPSSSSNRKAPYLWFFLWVI
jgi:hypothetical protein